ncbi:LOW QUALITY PROTEIN: venom phosphodiesterase 2-like [Penaeus chinensis]|uniref:LOW QUALITY PROTEIN: venom phosphodiesterase 2-like n=1 Tax=Penaeus chinensis TaxID=139456 RepID=UPI001FB70965|nr:LOW QUALITY PROTEIN: venom phosphodiesterase 2-like [Penaeus chinensis]
MKQSRGYIIGGAVAVVLVVIVVMAVLVSPKPEIRACPASYESHPLILVSLDGFRADYLEKGLTPGLQALVDGGVHAPFMKPSYPTLTFPNHYTIVTGLYPESHGIIANKFYDPEYHATFSMGSEESLQGRWWGGEPIWNTLTRQGKMSATFFWPGSEADIGGQHPTYWLPYNDDTLFSERVQQVLSWITLPAEDRPAWVSLYLNEPDHTGHGEGPDSNQVEALIMYADRSIQQLVSGLEDLGLLDCVNLVLVADHGMVASGLDKIIKLQDYVADIYDLAYTYSGAFGRISLKNDSEGIEMDVLEKLTCRRSPQPRYPRTPRRGFPLKQNRRIENIVLDLDAGYTVSVSSDFYLEGQHGYDNYEQKMNVSVRADGGEKFTRKRLLDTTRFINSFPSDIAKTHLDQSQSPSSFPQEAKPPAASYPSAEVEVARLTLSGCEGDLAAVEPWMSSLDLSEAQKQEAEARHLPWGVLHSGNLSASLVLLNQSQTP